MDLSVLLEVCGLCKLLAALVTLVGPLPSMDPGVSLEVTAVGEDGPAHPTLVAPGRGCGGVSRVGAIVGPTSDTTRLKPQQPSSRLQKEGQGVFYLTASDPIDSVRCHSKPNPPRYFFSRQNIKTI